jgi:hypothetical protein
VIVAVMQPYYFPYVGYFQLMSASEVFVLYDDVQYSKGSWANRNRILRGGNVSWLTLPVGAAPLASSYRERNYLLGPAQRRSHLGRIASAYRRAPQFEAVYPLVESLMAFEDERVAAFNVHLVSRLATHLGIRCQLRLGSEFDNPRGDRAQDRILQICGRLGATTYLNAIGGTGLYHEAAFAQVGIALRFLQPVATPYPQAAPAFVPFLSILDVLMNNALEDVQRMVAEGRVIAPVEARGVAPAEDR